MHHRIMVRKERESKNELQGSGVSSPKSLQSQMPPHPKNRLPLNRLEACSRTTSLIFRWLPTAMGFLASQLPQPPRLFDRGPTRLLASKMCKAPDSQSRHRQK